MTDRRIVIEERFQGPPGSGNGGYVCGRLARFLDATGARVRLRRPPPLGRALEVRENDGGVSLLEGDVLLAEARPAEVELEPPSSPSYAAAEAAARAYPGFASHSFPSCFVCGPARRAGDGLRIFPGPLDGDDRVACPWVPDPSLASAAGRVEPEFLWAALDCPGAFAVRDPGETRILLGDLRVELWGHVSVGERCVLVAWLLDHEDRKLRTATALFGESGACRGLGIGTWIDVPEPPVPSTD